MDLDESNIEFEDDTEFIIKKPHFEEYKTLS